jgi:hypothetical protein
MGEKKGRSYEKTFEVKAPVEAVWQAITDGDELSRWFCQEASCEAGVGGKQVKDWDRDHHRLGAGRPPPHRGRPARSRQVGDVRAARALCDRLVPRA